MDGEVLLRVEEAAKRLGCGRSKVYEMLAQQTLPAVRLGPRCVRIPALALDKWIASRTVGGSSEAA